MKKVFISHSILDADERKAVEFLKRKLGDAGFQPLTIDQDVPLGSSLVEISQDYIRRASIVLCVLSSERGARYLAHDTEPMQQLLFELGYAVGIGKKVILLKHPESPLLSYLQSLPTVSFDAFDSSSIYELIRQIEGENTDDDRIETLLRETPRAIFEVFHRDKNAFEKVDSIAFERVIRSLFAAHGYSLDSFGRDSGGAYDFAFSSVGSSQVTLVQVKKYSSNNRVSAGQVRELMGAIYAERAGRGIFISTTSFTSSAFDFAERCQPKIDLWTMTDLEKILV